MAFNFLEVGVAIRNALVTNLSGLVQSVHVFRAPSDTVIQVGSLPYVVIFPENFGFAPESFDEIASDIVWQVQVIDHAGNGGAGLAAAVAAIIGNAVPPGKATSGLHRRDISIGGTNTVSTMGAVPGEGQFGGTLYIDGDPDASGMFLRFQAVYTKG